MIASRVLALLLLVTVSRVQTAPVGQGPTPETPAPADTVWYWFATCGGPTMALEVQLDGVRLYQASFPVCRADRASPQSQGEAARFSFWFEPRRAIVWTGYRDRPDSTSAHQRVEGDVWQAGADSGDLVLGLSFMTPSRIMMNTTHIARPGAPDTTVIARGLVVLTYPSKPLR